MRCLTRLRAVALAFPAALLVVLALLRARSAKFYFEAVTDAGAVAAATPVAFALAAATALWALRETRAGDDPGRRGRAGLCCAVAASCTAAAVHLAAVSAPAQHPQSVSELVHGMIRLQPEPAVAMVLVLLASSPLVARLLRLPGTLALPPILAPGAVIGALAALDRPTGCEAVLAPLLLATTFGLWMLLDVAAARAARSGRGDAAGAGAGASAADCAANSRRWPAGDRARFVLGVLACCGVAVWLTWPSWRPGIIINADAPRHLLRAKIMAEMFLPAGHIDGWSPYWYLGAQLFLFQSYGYFFLIGAAADLLDGWVRLQSVFKFFYAAPIVVLPASVAWLARGVGASRRAALAAAFASMALSSRVGYGIGGVYGTGLLLQGVGVVMFALVWPLVLDALEGRRRAAWTASLLLGGILVTHFITGAYVMAAAGVVAVAVSLSRREAAPLVCYGAMAIAALLLSAHTLFPSLELRHMAGGAVGWGDPEDRFARFLIGRGVGPPWFVVPALIAALVAVVRRRGRIALAALLLFGTALLATSVPSPLEPAIVRKILGVLLRPRAQPYATLMTAVFVGVAVDALFSRIVSTGAPASREPSNGTAVWPWRQAAALLLCVTFVGAGLAQMASLRHAVSTEATLRRSKHRDYAQLVHWLRTNVPTPAVVEINRRGLPSQATGAHSVISILNLDTGLFTLGGDQAELTSANSRTRSLHAKRLVRGAEWTARRLRSFGVSYVIATDVVSRQRLNASAEYQNVYESTSVAVYRIRNSGAWLTGSGIESKSFVFEPERMRWQVLARSSKPRQATVAVSWHPNWRVLVDGRPVEVVGTSRHLLSFEIAPGAHSVDLKYVRRRSELVYNMISLATLVVVVGGLAWTLRAARSTAPR
ncbi:MAG: hypothetical protein HY899_12290 [Deltaproteobacteria bacterium]|nr:hypothetical protein [Deltaproteobacteria bacterium]